MGYLLAGEYRAKVINRTTQSWSVLGYLRFRTMVLLKGVAQHSVQHGGGLDDWRVATLIYQLRTPAASFRLFLFENQGRGADKAR